MSRTTETLTTKKTVFGFKSADFLGILIMLIPFLITFKSFEAEEEVLKKVFLFYKETEIVSKSMSLNPNMLSALCSMAFYCALITRLGLFKTDTLMEGIVTALRTFLNVWVIAGLLKMIVPTAHVQGLSLSAFFQNYQTVFLLLGIILSWLGMRTISGYCWILYIIAAWKNLVALNDAMGMWGALFVITLSISLLLQISAYTNISDFVQDFRGSAASATSGIRDNMSAAAYDVSQKANNVSTFVKDNVSAYTPVKIRSVPKKQEQAQATYYVSKNAEGSPQPSKAMPAGRPEDIIKALDANGDGVVDEQDVEILRKKTDL